MVLEDEADFVQPVTQYERLVDVESGALQPATNISMC
jgi:hypothetical protein